MKKTLGLIIKKIVEEASEPLRVAQIKDKIYSDGLWTKKSDGELPSIQQIRARIIQDSNEFIIRNKLVYLVKPQQDRLCKIVWNTKHWIEPIKRTWHKKYQKDNNRGYEQKHGYVGEDWLFNVQFVHEGYQYGYIRGIGKMASDESTVKKVFLFTINPHTKERYYVGKLFNVERMFEKELPKAVRQLFRSYHNDMIEQVRDKEGDFENLEDDPIWPNLRFKIEDKKLFPELFLIRNNQFAGKYFRTTAIWMTENLRQMFDELEQMTVFTFEPSSPDDKLAEYERKTRSGKSTVKRIHLEMERALYQYLLQTGVSSKDIACDTSSFGGKLADVVVRLKPNRFDIYEIKTDGDLRRGLRSAIGQLLDYATWEKSIEVENIYAVLPFVELSAESAAFIDRLKKTLQLTLQILWYDNTNKQFTIG